jgi:hypothetical protein
MSTDEWNTPLDLARLLGSFTTDPCSNATSHIQASTSYSLTERNEDGLALHWPGSVFVNWPYSKPYPWCERLVAHEGPWVALAKLDPSTKWWAKLMESTPIVAPFRKRLTFESPGDTRGMTANFPSVLIYSAWRPSRELAAKLWLPTYAQQGATP